jgi:hypothetical protein
VRTTFRLCLVAAVIAAIGMVAVPVASAATGNASISDFEKTQNKKIKKAKKKAKNANEKADNALNAIDGLQAADGDQNGRLDSLESTVNAIVAAAGDIVDGLTALQDGLVAVDAALNDPVTGLVGLNNARPQFGVFEADGNFLGGTGTGAGQGPGSDADHTVGSGTYVIDFANNVLDRTYSVNTFPTAGIPDHGSAINCEALRDSGTALETACLDADDADSRLHDLVVVFFQATNNGAPDDPDNGFSITAIHG